MKPLRIFSVLSLFLICGGCTDGSDSSSPISGAEFYDTEHRIFDGVDIEVHLKEHPNATFFVDLREPQTYSFDQTEVDIEFSHFLVQSSSMDSPASMEDFAQSYGISLKEAVLTLWDSEFEPHHGPVHRCGCDVMCDDPGDPCWSEMAQEVVCGNLSDDCVTLVWGLPFTP